MTAFTLLLFVCLLWGVFLTAHNLYYLSRRWPQNLPAKPPLISVLIPARNEERNIARCLRSYLACQYPHFEVLLMDDDSSDQTAAIAKSIAAQDKRLKLFSSKPRPEGWIGKNWACQQLAGKAKGEYLLFVDADTQARPALLSYLLCEAQRRGSDLLSGMTKQVMPSFWPAVGIPFLYSGTLAFFPLALLEQNWLKVGFANGQCMFFKREAYQAIGGHASVAGHIVEDVGLGYRVKKLGKRLSLVDLSRHVHCQMYRSFREVWEGFSKNMYRVLNYPWLLPLVIIPHFLLWVFPWLWLAWSLMQGQTWQQWLVPATLVLTGLWPRFMSDFYFGHSLWLSWLNPVTIVFIDSILLNSLRLHFHPQGVSWKGRRYKV